MPAAQLRSDLAAALPQAQVVTAAKQDRFTLDGLEKFISIIRIALLVFGGVAILVGAFTIFNTLSITVAQRTRELGLLRMVGAHRRQVLGSVLVEALAIGVLASAGRPRAPGYGLAQALDALFDSMGLELPEAGTVFAARTIVVALLVGTLVTLVAGLLPAWRATRVAPVEALRASTPGAGRAAAPGARRAGARVAARPPGAGARRRGGRARAAQRDAPARPHDGDRDGADDRRRAGHARHGRRRGPEGHDARRARAARRREPRDHRRGRLVADRAGGRAGARAAPAT